MSTARHHDPALVRVGSEVAPQPSFFERLTAIRRRLNIPISHEVIICQKARGFANGGKECIATRHCLKQWVDKKILPT